MTDVMERAGELMSRAAREIETLRTALELIAAHEGQTLLCPPDSRDANDAGAAAAFANLGSLARSVLAEHAKRNADP